MKILPTIATLLALAISNHAEEPNPFVNKGLEKSPLPPSGDSFVNLIEHILVPADQLDAWLEKNPLAGDASNLRKQAQIWITQKTARLDHTALSTGIAGREFFNESIWEQTYATEYEPPDPGEWPIPTSFETRNLGYDQSGSAGIEDGGMTLRTKMGYVAMLLPHHAWNELAEKTRQPDDVFIPRFRSLEVTRQAKDAAGSPVAKDPFASSAESAKPLGSNQLRFDPGKNYLVSREDNESQEPTVSPHPNTIIKPAPRDPHHLVRLIFFRGNICSPTTTPQEDAMVINHMSLKLIRVKHPIFSAWIQETDLLEVPDLAWKVAMDWQKNGDAETSVTLTTANRTGSKFILDSHEEVIYPTEWEPGGLAPAWDGNPARKESSNPTAFDTRNVGTSFGAETSSDPKGTILQFNVMRVRESGRSVHHRIFRDGGWKADMTFPIFSSNRWTSELRVRPGEWLLVGSGADIDAKGKLDPEHSVLAFIKLD